MKLGKERRILIDWGHLALVAFIGVVAVAYLFDARATSLKLNNLLLVQPAAILALVFIALILPQIFSKVLPSDVPVDSEKRKRLIELMRVGLLAAAFGVFVFSLELLGFDVATFIFVAAGIYICGERKIWLVVLYSAVFTLLLVLGYEQLVPYPFPNTFL